MKLISKNADDRYQSAFGLVSNLREWLERLNRTSRIKSFKLARKDISSRFIIPWKLFGRG
jgi:hypothetical protein